MKKITLTILKIFGVILLLFVGLWFVYRTITINNLEDKLLKLEQSWIEVVKLQDENLDLVKNLLDNVKEEVLYSDSLRMKLVDLDTERDVFKECDSILVYDHYLLNKYMLPLLNDFSENESLNEVRNQDYLGRVEMTMNKLNNSIEEYNHNVTDYNSYKAVFPNFIIAKSQGFEYKNYFEIQYGILNKDPEKIRKERREWQREIEKRHGLSD